MTKLIQRVQKFQAGGETQPYTEWEAYDELGYPSGYIEGSPGKSLAEIYNIPDISTGVNLDSQKLRERIEPKKYWSLRGRLNNFVSLLGIDKDRKIGPALASAVFPAIAGGSLIMNLRQLKKAKEEASKMTSPTILSGQAPIRPIQGIPQEILQRHKDLIAGIRTKKTADATTNAMSEQMTNAQKLKAGIELAAMEAENLSKERSRYDQLAAISAQANAQAMNEQSKLAAETSNKKALIAAEYEGAKRDTLNQWIKEALIEPAEKRIAYNMGVEGLAEQEKWNRLQQQLYNYQYMLKNDPTNTALKTEIERLMLEQKNLSESSLPSYSSRGSYLIQKTNKNADSKV